MEKPIIIAYYLPQFHPFDLNDKWWGKGFTEWTNVGKAKPLFKGHYQPKVPADLGYYDLRMPEIREGQVELAKEAGVTGFCYWHYWFGNKRQLLNEIIDEVIFSGKPDFPFCFGWANESWKAKQWKNGSGDKMLMEQIYGGEKDYRDHFEYALKAFKDTRYLKVGNKPIFVIYRPNEIPDDFTSLWNKWAQEEGFDGIYFIGNLRKNDGTELCLSKGILNMTFERWTGYNYLSSIKKLKIRILSRIKGVGIIRDYKDCIDDFADNEIEGKENVIPTIVPNWDHSPRSGRRATILQDCKPEYFYEHCIKVLNLVKNKNNKIILLKSWNEWGEGNYMEPDLKYGKGYIKALRDALDKTFGK